MAGTSFKKRILSTVCQRPVVAPPALRAGLKEIKGIIFHFLPPSLLPLLRYRGQRRTLRPRVELQVLLHLRLQVLIPPPRFCPSFRAPELPFRCHAQRIFLSRAQHSLSHLGGGMKVLDRLAAPFVCEEVLHLEPVLSSSRFIPDLCRKDPLLSFPLRALLEEVPASLVLVAAPPAGTDFLAAEVRQS